MFEFEPSYLVLFVSKDYEILLPDSPIVSAEMLDVLLPTFYQAATEKSMFAVFLPFASLESLEAARKTASVNVFPRLPRPNARNYPFNYLVATENIEVEFSRYQEAESYIKTNFSDSFIEEGWGYQSQLIDPNAFSDLVTRVDELYRVVWDSKDSYDQLRVTSQRVWDEEFGDPIEYLTEVRRKHVVAIISRCRDQYEEALHQYRVYEDMFERFMSSMSHENEDSETELEMCPCCGSDGALGFVRDETLRECANCGEQWREAKCVE